MPKLPPPYQWTHHGNPGLCTPGIKVLVNECITEIFLIRIYIYIYIYIYTYIYSQIVLQNPCFSLFMLHNNQGSEIKNYIFLHFNILSFMETFSLLLPKYYYLPTTKKVFVKDSKLKRKKHCLYIKIYIYIYNIYIHTYIYMYIHTHDFIYHIKFSKKCLNRGW